MGNKNCLKPFQFGLTGVQQKCGGLRFALFCIIVLCVISSFARQNWLLYLNCILDFMSIGIVSANSVESDLRCTSRFYFDSVTLMSQKPCQHDNKCDCSETNGYNIPK